MPHTTPGLIFALYGPTSSGKTAMSLDLGERLRDELGVEPVVISADSRQVYRHMDIGTSKTRPGEMRGIRHEMIDVAEPTRKFELDAYVRQARGHIEDCFAHGRLPLIVGGTTVYVRSLLEGWQVDRTAAAKAALRKDFPRGMADDAYATLRRLDPAAAGRVHRNNYEGVLNALAAAMAGAEERAGTGDETRNVVLGIDPPQARLDERVARTLDDQLDRGLLGEVVELADRYDLDTEMRRRGRRSDNQVLHTHGYREFFEVSAAHGHPVAALTDAEVATARDSAVATIQAYTRRQKGGFAKLRGLTRVRDADHAFAEVTAALHRR